MRSTSCIACTVLALVYAVQTEAQPPVEKAVVETTQQWNIGVQMRAGAGAAQGIEATLPFPLKWPEQDVEVVGVKKSDNISRVDFRSLGEGAQQMVVTVGQLRPGESAYAVAEVRLQRRVVDPPDDLKTWTVPKRLPKELRGYLLPSPYIDSRHTLIRKAVRELPTADGESDWRRVEAIYDWVRRQVRYEFDAKIRSSVDALKTGHGDCEELTSLFIAMCRAAEIPARAVWVPGHCYPEFYLVDAQGKGRWFPCQAAGTRSFGEIVEWRPILQKGDRFKVTGKKGYQRYVAESLRAKRAAAPLEVKFIREPQGDARATKIAD